MRKLRRRRVMYESFIQSICTHVGAAEIEAAPIVCDTEEMYQYIHARLRELFPEKHCSYVVAGSFRGRRCSATPKIN